MVEQHFRNDAVRYIEDLRVEKYRTITRPEEITQPQNEAEVYAMGLELLIRRVMTKARVKILPYRVQLYAILEQVRESHPELAPGYLALVIEEEYATAKEMGGVDKYHKWLGNQSALERQIGFNFVRQ